MGIRFMTLVLIRFCFLIFTLAIAAGIASAQESLNSVLFVSSSFRSDINRNHFPVGNLNRGLNSNVIILGGSFNQQDVNRTHISVGDLNSDPDLIGTKSSDDGSLYVDSLKEEIPINPNSAEAYFRLGLAYTEIGRNEDALEAYRQAISLDPDFAEAHFLIGLSYMTLGRYSEAIEDFNQVIRILPKEPAAPFVQGLVFVELNDFDSAIEALTRAIRIKPDFAEAHFVLGLSHLHLGDKKSALSEYIILKNNNQDLADRLFKQIYR